MSDKIELEDVHANEVRTIAELGARAAGPLEVGRGGVYLAPDGKGGVDLLEVADEPVLMDRVLAGRVVSDADAFVAYVKRHGSGQTEIWADASNNRVVGVIDSNDPGTDGKESLYGREQHRVRLELAHTPSWLAWVAGQKITDQVRLAEFFEEYAEDIVEPSSGELLEIAQTLHGTNRAEFKSGTRLSTGEIQLAYVEDIQGKAGRSGNLTIPDEFKIALCPYLGGERYAVTAKLKRFSKKKPALVCEKCPGLRA